MLALANQVNEISYQIWRFHGVVLFYADEDNPDSRQFHYMVQVLRMSWIDNSKFGIRTKVRSSPCQLTRHSSIIERYATASFSNFNTESRNWDQRTWKIQLNFNYYSWLWSKVVKIGEVLYLPTRISDFTGGDNYWIEHMRFELHIWKYIVYFVFSSIMYYPSGRKFSFEFHFCYLAIGKNAKFIISQWQLI